MGERIMQSSVDITFWDVQHGNATHIQTPNGKWVVLDLGDGEPTLARDRFSPLKRLRARGVTQIDHLIITHPHRDHIDDIENINLFYVDLLTRPVWLTEAEIRQGNQSRDADKVSRYLTFNQVFSGALAPTNNPSVPENWGGAVFRHYESRDVPSANLNNHSIVTFVEYAGIKVMIPGDNEALSWRSLLQQPAFVKELPSVHVFLVPHHGREAGFCVEVFDAGLRPVLTVISDDQAGDTSVTAKYAARTSGWKVYARGYQEEDRYCVTTRCDGTISVRFGYDGTATFLQVTTEK